MIVSGHLSPHPTSGSDFRFSREASIGSPHGMRRVCGTPHTSAVGFYHTARGMRHPRNLPSLSSCHPTSSVAIITFPHSSQTHIAIDVRQSHGGGLLSDCEGAQLVGSWHNLSRRRHPFVHHHVMLACHVVMSCLLVMTLSFRFRVLCSSPAFGSRNKDPLPFSSFSFPPSPPFWVGTGVSILRSGERILHRLRRPPRALGFVPAHPGVNTAFPPMDEMIPLDP